MVTLCCMIAENLINSEKSNYSVNCTFYAVVTHGVLIIGHVISCATLLVVVLTAVVHGFQTFSVCNK